ncbi:MAG: nucleotide exchange factor GrpE [Dethiobacteria bacterium]|nr:nucleotide exchange factor GrpE [Bacillota bacterium]
MEETKDNQGNNIVENKISHALKKEVEELRQELAEEKNRHLRTRADFDNFRKRVEREMDAKRNQIKKEILLDLLMFLDYFDQAKKQVQDPAAASGLEIMARQFNELLHKHGVRPVECLGLPFDPEEQEGLGFVATEQCPEGCVAEEVCSGYKLGDILLKPAQVMVAKKP